MTGEVSTLRLFPLWAYSEDDDPEVAFSIADVLSLLLEGSWKVGSFHSNGLGRFLHSCADLNSIDFATSSLLRLSCKGMESSDVDVAVLFDDATAELS